MMLPAARENKPLLARKKRKPSFVVGSVVFLVFLLLLSTREEVREQAAEELATNETDKYASPFVENATALETPLPYKFAWGGDNANLSVALELCSEFDDDAFFPNTACDEGDARTQCEGDMVVLPRYHELCYDAACTQDGPVWGLPCAWQAIKQLPRTCEGTFEPTPPVGTSRGVPNRYPDLDSAQRWALGYTSTFAGPCNAHAFCFSCLDDRYEFGVDPYCRAVFDKYGATPEAPRPSSFFSDLDSYWCTADVLEALAKEALILRRR